MNATTAITTRLSGRIFLPDMSRTAELLEARRLVLPCAHVAPPLRLEPGTDPLAELPQFVRRSD